MKQVHATSTMIDKDDIEVVDTLCNTQQINRDCIYINVKELASIQLALYRTDYRVSCEQCRENLKTVLYERYK